MTNVTYKKLVKYCKFHKSYSHNTAECKAQKGEGERDDSKPYTMAENKPKPNTIELTINLTEGSVNRWQILVRYTIT